MYILKRDGRKQDIHFDKITERIKKLANREPILLNIDPILVSQKVVAGLYNGVTTVELDNLACETAIALSMSHPDYETLASRLAISNLHKSTVSSYEETCDILYNHMNKITKEHAPLISEECYQIIKSNIEKIQTALDYQKDYDYEYFGFKTLEKAYLLKVNGKVVERIQHMHMRVAIGIHKNDIDSVLKSYELMSNKMFIHSTPTLYNSGTPHPSLSSCFLLQIKEDSVEGIYDTLKQCALVSKACGGVGLSIHDVRSRGAYIKSIDGYSEGIIPMLKNFNDTAKYITQGSKRKGSFAIYLEPHHAEIEDFLELKLNNGKEERRCRDLFYGLWVSDLFMTRVEKNLDWSLFCPSEAPGLSEVYGEEFVALYEKYEREGKAKKVIKAQTLWFKIVDTQIETGMPYMLYKDTINSHNNQSNLGTIKSSNLCIEINQYTSPKEIAVCNLASIALPKFVIHGQFDHQLLYDVVYHVIGNLNKVIDTTLYPLPEARYSNLKHRPLGLGVQGLANTFFLLRYPFDSNEAKQLNQEIFETMYFAAAQASCDLAKIHGPYESFQGSPSSKGILCPDMWGHQPTNRWDFERLRQEIIEYGLRNSLLISVQPTASTSNILSNVECIEPITSNIYTRSVLAGEFIMINKYLINDLIDLGLWNEQMKNKIILNNGSVQAIDEIPSDIKLLYRTVWEISQKHLIDMNADRGMFVCQGQSMNCFISVPNKSKISSMLFYGWHRKIKGGLYYLRTKPGSKAIQFTVDQEVVKKVEEDICESCM